MIWRTIAFIALCIMVLCEQPAVASCPKKNAQIDQAIARLVDLSTSDDIEQQIRDKNAIRMLVSDMTDEDCVGATAEMGRLHYLLESVSNAIDVTDDYSLNDADLHNRYLSLIPIQIQSYYSRDSSQDATCRCYARQAAIRAVFSEMESMLTTYASPNPMTAREYRAMVAWNKVLDGYLSDLIGVHVAKVTQIDGRNLARLAAIADGQLQKHCGATLFGSMTEPAYGECKYRTSHGGPTPNPTPTSEPT